MRTERKSLDVIAELMTSGYTPIEGYSTKKWEGTLLANASSITGMVDLPEDNALEYQFVLGGVLQEPTVDFTIDSENGIINIVGDVLTVDTDFFLIYRSVAVAGLTEVEEQIQNLSSFVDVVAVDDIYNIDLENATNKKIAIETEDEVSKEISLSNVPTRCQLFLELTYTNECAITWFDGVNWLSGFAPTLYEGKTYVIVFFTNDGGVTWNASTPVGW